MIYFIQAGKGGPVKIGYALRPETRLRSLQVGNPHRLEMLATMEGGWSTEAKLHKRFESGRMAGEWFEITTPGLMDMIDKLRSGMPIVPPRKPRVAPVIQMDDLRAAVDRAFPVENWR